MKLRFLTGAALGYVLGTRAGRQRYEQILGSLQDLTDSDLARQIKGEITKLTSGGSSSSANGLAAAPVVAGPAPDGKTGTKMKTNVVLPDLESSTVASAPVDSPPVTDGDSTKGKPGSKG